MSIQPPAKKLAHHAAHGKTVKVRHKPGTRRRAVMTEPHTATSARIVADKAKAANAAAKPK